MKHPKLKPSKYKTPAWMVNYGQPKQEQREKQKNEA